MASTTSTQNSGLLDYILPKFEQETGIAVRVIAVGTGKAIKIAENGDVDVLMVHHRPSEDAFIKAGFGIDRRDVMYNDFILIGPDADPANVRAKHSIVDILKAISSSESTFASRGDESGTHKKERAIWGMTKIDPKGSWYRETGSGMGATLNIASGMDAYTLTDRGTWLSFGNRGNLTLLFEGEPPLHNPYGIILVNPELHPHIKSKYALTFMDWLTSPKGQQTIANYEISGQQAFFVND